jgi:pimeloyl-ACP methyl ester carboxylesterase
MADRFIVLGGWGVGVDILGPCFHADSIFIDVNNIMPMFFNGDLLIPDWTEKLRQHINVIFSGDSYCLAGWSTGAIMACALALKYDIAKLVLLSATPSFCRKESFKTAQRAVVLNRMIDELDRNPAEILKRFVSQCGIVKDWTAGNYKVPDLKSGLRFLEQADIIQDLRPLNFPCFVFHGKDDLIIPHPAGKFLAESIGADFISCEGGHAFFTDYYEKIRQI